MSVESTQRAKYLQSRITEFETDLRGLNEEIAAKNAEKHAKQQQLKAFREDLDKIKNTEELKVSEHAIVRYFERVLGFDIKEIEDKILGGDLPRLVDELGGSGKFPLGENQIVLKGYTVTTIV